MLDFVLRGPSYERKRCMWTALSAGKDQIDREQDRQQLSAGARICPRSTAVRLDVLLTSSRSLLSGRDESASAVPGERRSFVQSLPSGTARFARPPAWPGIGQN